MTNNIEKLYELAKVKKIGKKLTCSLLDFGACKNINCSFCDKAKLKEYPPLSSEKQLKLIKWLAFEKRVSIKFTNGKWNLNTAEMGISASAKYEPFEQLLADFICFLWNDLTEVQREEVRGILQ